MKKLINQKEILLVCGSGGVGKTTTSAAIALKAAASGKKVVVMTIDPAKRLATSLGLSELTGKPKPIPASFIKKQLGVSDIQLDAMMLDTKSTFDHLVTTYAPDKETEKKILNNKIYQHLSHMIVGSQEYMAMEKLYEIYKEQKYDLFVIDTPPTIHAVDFLEAPERMINALSHSMIHLLLKPAMLVGKSGLKLLEKGSKIILKVMDRVVGFAFLQEISEMLISFQSLLAGFESRAGQVKEILESQKTGFVLVSACEDKSMEEAAYFKNKLEELNLSLEGVILNRVHPYYKVTKPQRQKDEAALKKQMGAKLTAKMLTIFDVYEKTAKRDQNYYNKLDSLLDDNQFLTDIPLFQSDIHDLKGLDNLGSYLNI